VRFFVSDIFYTSPRGLEEVRAVVSKRGVDDGNQKGGGFLQPAQESQYHYSTGRGLVKPFFAAGRFFPKIAPGP
jgi:hypothetical protein